MKRRSGKKGKKSGAENKYNVKDLSMKMREEEEEERDDVLEEMVRLRKKVDRQNSVDMLI